MITRSKSKTIREQEQSILAVNRIISHIIKYLNDIDNTRCDYYCLDAINSNTQARAKKIHDLYDYMLLDETKQNLFVSSIIQPSKFISVLLNKTNELKQDLLNKRELLKNIFLPEKQQDREKQQEWVETYDKLMHKLNEMKQYLEGNIIIEKPVQMQLRRSARLIEKHKQ